MEYSSDHSRQQDSIGKWLAIMGIVIHVLGLLVLAVSLSRAVVELNSVGFGQAGIGDPSVMRDAMEGVTKRFFVFNFMSQGIGAFGNFLFVLALVARRYRAVWFFWFICIWSVLSAPSFPIGTGFGIFFLVYALSRKEEFLRPQSVSPSLS